MVVGGVGVIGVRVELSLLQDMSTRLINVTDNIDLIVKVEKFRL
jgi:hypothetical protein